MMELKNLCHSIGVRIKKLCLLSFLIVLTSCSYTPEKKEKLSLILTEREDDVLVELINTSNRSLKILRAIGGFWEGCASLYADVQFEPKVKSDTISGSNASCHVMIARNSDDYFISLNPKQKIETVWRKHDVFSSYNYADGRYGLRAVYDFTERGWLSAVAFHKADADESIFVGKVFSEYLYLDLE